jgi:hypothetical protein
VLAILAVLRVALGGSAPPIPSAARRGEASPGRGRKAGVPLEPKSWIGEIAAWTMLSGSGLCECRPNNPHLCRLKIPQVV